jgi:hypothetical protein
MHDRVDHGLLERHVDVGGKVTAAEGFFARHGGDQRRAAEVAQHLLDLLRQGPRDPVAVGGVAMAVA